MKNTFYLLFLLAFTQLNAQYHPSCDGQRYLDNIFDDATVTTEEKFGEGTTFGGNFQELYMDIYEPEGDMVENRPLIILAFGGSFIGGTRQEMDWLCRAYTRKGFVTATIDYRLYDGPFFPLPSAEDMTDVVAKSVSDMKAAIRFFRENAEISGNTYSIDPDYIFVGGISAGGIVAAHTAVLDTTDTFTPELWEIFENNGGINGNSSDNTEYSSAVSGFLNFSGALNSASWIDENDPPFFSIHDELDGTVPYGEGFASILTFDIIAMEGSQIMHQTADDLDIFNKLHTIEGSMGHVSYFQGSNTEMQAFVDSSALFVQELICGVMVPVNSPLDRKTTFDIYPNPTNGIIEIKGNNLENTNVTILNSTGQEVRSLTLNGSATIDLSNLTNGMYFIRFEGKEFVATKKLFKN